VSQTLAGQLLIAAPSLFDYFRRTVVLMIEHTPEGAIGVVLNKESEARVAEAVPQLAELAGQDDLVRIGGPVAPQSVVALGEFGDPSEAGTHVVGQLGTLDPDSPNESLLRLRVYAGYAGWGAGQLEGELQREDWFLEPARVDDVFSAAPGDLWSSVLERKGGSYRLVSRMPDDPSLN
jgi:putative transcriptional regulator